MNELGSQITAAAVISFVIGWLKKSPWFPWITTETAKLNRVAAVVLSGLAALGLHFQFNHSAGSLLITGLSLQGFLLGAWHWGSQFAITHGWFKATSSSDQILELLRAVLAGPGQTAGKQ